MSNYNYQNLPESLKDFADQIDIAAEVINATGEVRLICHDPDRNAEHTTTVYLSFTIRQARDLAECIYQAACEADLAVMRQNALDRSQRPKYLRCGKETRREVDESHVDLGPCVLLPDHDGDCSLVRT